MRLIALLIIIAIAVCAVVIPEHKPPNAGLPIVKAAAPICIAPSSHYQWKQRRIA